MTVYVVDWEKKYQTADLRDLVLFNQVDWVV